MIANVKGITNRRTAELIPGPGWDAGDPSQPEQSRAIPARPSRHADPAHRGPPGGLLDHAAEQQAIRDVIMGPASRLGCRIAAAGRQVTQVSHAGSREKAARKSGGQAARAAAGKDPYWLDAMGPSRRSSGRARLSEGSTTSSGCREPPTKEMVLGGSRCTGRKAPAASSAREKNQLCCLRGKPLPPLSARIAIAGALTRHRLTGGPADPSAGEVTGFVCPDCITSGQQQEIGDAA